MTRHAIRTAFLPLVLIVGLVVGPGVTGVTHQVQAQQQAAEKTYTRKQAYRASTNQIVLHYGEGIVDADLLAVVLTEDGYPAIALPGGSDGQVELFVGRGKFGFYDQRDLNRETLGGNAQTFYKIEVLDLPPQREVFPLAK